MTRAAGTVLARFDARIEITLRLARRGDLRPLEWLGMFLTHRIFIEDAFARQRRGEVLMLLAVAGDFPIGQLWVDLSRKADAGVGVLWAFRVLPGLRGTGIGSRLLRCAEAQLRGRGLLISEVGVERDNPDARRLYERMGYAVSGVEHEVAEYVTHDGRTERVDVDQWILQKPLEVAVESEELDDGDIDIGVCALSAREAQ